MSELINGDFYEIIKNIPDKSIDMIFTDPPYNITKNKWESALDYETLWSEYKRIITDNGAIAIWTQFPFSHELVMSNRKMFRYEWVIEKTSAKGFLNAHKMPMRAHENVMIFYKKLPIYNPQKTTGHERKVSTAEHKRNSKKTTNYGEHNLVDYDSTERFPRDVLKFSWDTQKSSLHPTQKPLAACEYFIKTYTNENMTVLDNFMGSGTICLAAKNLNRNYIGIEIDKEMFDIAINRIEGEL